MDEKTRLEKWQDILETLDDVIAGRTISPEKDVSVGDKRISYLSIDELLKYRNFVVKRISEEKAKEEGKTKSSFGKIKYLWRSI